MAKYHAKLVKISQRLEAARTRAESLREKWMQAGRVYEEAEKKADAISAEHAAAYKQANTPKKPFRAPQFDYEALDRAADLRVQGPIDRCGAENSEGEQCVRAVFHGGAHRT